MAKPKTQYPPRKIVSVVFFGFLLLVGLYSVQNPKRLIPTPANTNEVVSYISGVVVDQNNTRLSGAKVSVQDALATTNGEGAFVLPLYPDVYTISISKKGYQSITRTIDIRDQRKVQMTFTMIPEQ